MTGYVWVLVVFMTVPASGERVIAVSDDLGDYAFCKSVEEETRQTYALEIALGKVVVEGCVLQQQE